MYMYVYVLKTLVIPESLDITIENVNLNCQVNAPTHAEDWQVMGIVTDLWNTNLIINPTSLFVPRHVRLLHVCFKDTI